MQCLTSFAMFEIAANSNHFYSDDSNDVNPKTQKWRKPLFQEAPKCSALRILGGAVRERWLPVTVAALVNVSYPVLLKKSTTIHEFHVKSVHGKLVQIPTEKRDWRLLWLWIHVQRWSQRLEEVKNLLIPQAWNWGEALPTTSPSRTARLSNPH